MITGMPDPSPRPQTRPTFTAKAPLGEIFALNRLDDSLFQGRSRGGVSTRTFGGEVLGQAIIAAGSTVPEDRELHSAQAYYLLPGDTALPVTYHVARDRDGGSFTTRTVTASQRDRPIFTATTSFQRPPAAAMTHQSRVMDAPDPDLLPDPLQEYADVPDALAWVRFTLDHQPVDLRFPEPPTRVLLAKGEPAGPRQRAWLRGHKPISSDRLTQAAALAYFSDLLLLSSALGPHGRTLSDNALQFATINHSIWYHAPLDPSDWFLYDMEGYWTGNDRAMCHGLVFDRQGTLCASTMQEGLLRNTHRPS